MNRNKPYSNYRMLRTIMSKMRQIDELDGSQFIILYSFLYKYCSDRLKTHFSQICNERSITLSEAYGDEILIESLKSNALSNLGYFITDERWFFDSLIDRSYQERFFIHQFYTAFSEHVEFEEGSKYQEYFDFIFTECSHAVNINKFEFSNPNHLIVKEIIFSISKLDITEENFPFEKVFDRLCQSKYIDAVHDPDYINFLISSIVSSGKSGPRDVYNPFLNDASLLINLYSDCDFPWKNTYAKGQDKLSYCCSLIKLLIYGFDLNEVCCEFGSAFEPLEDLSLKFDVILSRFPPITSRNLKIQSINQSYELLKQNKLNQVKSLLSDKLNIDEGSFDEDVELGSALENLIDKMDLDSQMDAQFTGQYESLKESEYLFLINMINSLNDDGIMVVSMHQSFLVKNSLQILRKFLTLEKNYVDAVISVPNELSRSSRLEIIMVFRKNRKSDEIMFIDLSKDFKTKKAPYIVPGSFRRNLLLSDSTISKVLDAYAGRKIIDRFSNIADISDLKANDFNLSISRYVDTFEGDFISLDELEDEKIRIDENMKKLNEKIDRMMRELDIRL